MKMIHWSGALLALSLVAPLAQAQDDDESEIEEIIVTGTKRSLGIQDTQTSVQVVTAGDIEDQAILNVEDILLRTSNVAAGGPNSLNNLSIRGVTLTGVGFSGVGTTANVYVDGSPNSFNANQGANNLWDVQQVEVLRGPQSTVQGRNALAGAIIINTADPVYEWTGKARVLVGNEDQRQGSFVVNAPIIEDQVAFRLTADYREVDFGVVNPDTGNNTRFEEAGNFRAKLLIEPSAIEDLPIELIAQVSDTQFGEFGAANPPVPADDPSFSNFDPFGDETFGIRTRFEDNVVTRYTADVQYALGSNWSLFGIRHLRRNGANRGFRTSE
ncbi:MAG: TonB-dependent receptor plug domain-containing protein [Pseudomonadota bacterium]